MDLIHTGAKDQKWGVRRYRNYDGTLTEEGKKRYDYYKNKTDRVYNTAKSKQMGPKTYVPTGRWGEYQEDLSKYSDAELKALTNRANLEKSYRESFYTKKYSGGRQLLNTLKNTTKEASEVISIGARFVNAINDLKLQLRKNKAITEGKFDNKPKNNAPKLGKR